MFNCAKPFVESLIKNLQQQGKQAETTQETNKNTSGTEPLIRHFGVTCDGCSSENIIGNRYKCAECDNFDYCNSCYNIPEILESHGGHKFIKIEKPNRQQQHPFSQFGGQGFDFTQLLNHPLAQQFLQQQGGQAQQFDLSNLLGNIQPFIEQFAQNFGAEQPQQTKPETKSEPQPTEEEIVINDDEAPVIESEEPKQPEIKQEIPKQQPTFAYTAQLEQLATMGFDDVEKNKELLQRYSGNVGRVVQVLLQ